MDGARRAWAEPEDDASVARGRERVDPPRSLSELEKIFRLPSPARDGETPNPRERAEHNPGFTARDISHAIDLVHEAANNIRAADERAREGEARTQALLQRAAEELKNADARAHAAEARARAAEARAQEAESRAKEAENWLHQIFATISEELPTRR